MLSYLSNKNSKDRLSDFNYEPLITGVYHPPLQQTISTSSYDTCHTPAVYDHHQYADQMTDHHQYADQLTDPQPHEDPPRRGDVRHPTEQPQVKLKEIH